MANQSRDIDSLTHFKRNTPQVLAELRETGEPLVLTVKGKAALVIQDAAAYQQLLDTLDRAQAIAGIREGLADVRAGRVRPLEDLTQNFRKKHDLQGRRRAPRRDRRR